MHGAVALGNNDIAFLAWNYDQRLPGCLGFAVYRTDAAGNREPLPAWVGFEGESNEDWRPSTTERWPVQKFAWRDFTAQPGGTYTYEIVPLGGRPGNLTPLAGAESLTTPEVLLTPSRSDHVRAYFNRGILSTQHLAHQLPQGPEGGPSGDNLLTHIEDENDPIRKSLAGQIVEGVTLLLDRARSEGGHCFCAIYELNDPELIAALDDPEHVSIVLSNAGESDDPDKTNHDSRAKLHGDHVDITDRLLPSGHIGHNKFVVYVDPAGQAQAVLTGSTNWTYTGLCAQSNNALVLESPELARLYLDYWNRIKDQSPVGAPATQSGDYRRANDAGHDFAVDGNAGRFWVSPNTQIPSKPPHDPPSPDDLAEVFELITGADKAILFLLFQPGSPSVLDPILDAQAAKPGLFVRGAATDPQAIDHFSVELFHRAGETAYVAAASSIDDQFGFWQRELLKTPGAHAIIHDKIVVVDPLSDDCVVITGSHNLGYRASYNNDDNLVVVKGHRKLAEAYAVHVMDVYEHYRWRYLLERFGPSAFTGLKRDDSWQEKYFTRPAAQQEVRFWLS